MIMYINNRQINPFSYSPSYPQNNGLGFFWIPFLIATAVSGAQSGTMAWLARRGPKQKTATSTEANDVEQKMIENLRAWESVPPEQRNYATKKVALDTFDRLWQHLFDFCNNPAMGEPGQRCISERDNIPGSTTGNDWNWFKLYRDPIDNYQTQDEQNPLVAQATAFTAGVDNQGNTVTGVGVDTFMGVPTGYVAGGFLLLAGLAVLKALRG